MIKFGIVVHLVNPNIFLITLNNNGKSKVHKFNNTTKFSWTSIYNNNNYFGCSFDYFIGKIDTYTN